MKLEDISSLAAREREKQKKSRERKPAGAKPIKEITPESWQVFNLISTRYMNIFLWYFIVLTLGIVFLLMYFAGNWSWSLYPALFLCTLFLIRFMGHQLLKLIDYQKFKNWRKRLPFQVIGWEHIIDNRDILKDEHWYLDVGVAISLKQATPKEALKVIDDSLFILITEANKSFYELNFSQVGFVGDIRKKWTKTGPTEARGSAYGYILGLIYRLITTYLHSVQKKWDVIQSVTVDFAGRVCHIRSVDISID